MAPIIPLAIGLLHAAIPLVEGLFGKKKGEEKKTNAIEFTKLLLGFWSQVSTGGQKQSVDELIPLLGPLVDQIAGKLFPSGTTVTPEEAMTMAKTALSNAVSNDEFAVLNEKLDWIIDFLKAHPTIQDAISQMTQPTP